MVARRGSTRWPRRSRRRRRSLHCGSLMACESIQPTRCTPRCPGPRWPQALEAGLRRRRARCRCATRMRLSATRHAAADAGLDRDARARRQAGDGDARQRARGAARCRRMLRAARPRAPARRWRCSTARR
ncbi:MAG: hypothetical protein MZW92_35440 [Comamonadaceae bacterium]|nr:hypothetical protein [Comamonadaceae bacterium]